MLSPERVALQNKMESLIESGVRPSRCSPSRTKALAVSTRILARRLRLDRDAAFWLYPGPTLPGLLGGCPSKQ